MTQTKATTAAERAYDLLKARILTAELAPNEQLLESDLAADLGMSRTPLREACIRLQSDGLVEVIPRRGVRIVPISPDDMADVYDLLATIEARAAELAASRDLTVEELGTLDDAVEAMRLALADGDLDSWAAADERFHRALVECSGNRHLAATAQQFSNRVQRARLVTLRLRPFPHKSVDDHAALVNAIRSGDTASAHKLHLEHRRGAAAQLTELLAYHRLGGL